MTYILTLIDALQKDLDAHEQHEGEAAEFRNVKGSWEDVDDRLNEIRAAFKDDSMAGRILTDLDRCEHGRHEGDACFGCPGGVSVGNVKTGGVIGYSLRATHRYVMPPRGQRHKWEAYVQTVVRKPE